LLMLVTQLFLGTKRALADFKRSVVRKGTDLKELVDKNPAELDTTGLEITPIEKFGVMGLDNHETSLENWRLIVDGDVDEPLSLTYEDILKFPAVEKTVLLICPGIFAYNGSWKGVSINRLLRGAGMKSDAGYVLVRGPQGKYEKVEKFSLSEVRTEEVFLAYQVNGVALPRKHGFPLRVAAKNHHGSEWVKYVFRVTFHEYAPSQEPS